MTRDARSVSTPDESRQPSAPSSLIQREILLVGVLSALAALLFFVTRAVAEWDRAATARTAAHWYVSGQQLLARGRVDEAIRSFRNAAADDPRNLQYSLALAGALISNHRSDEARRILRSGLLALSADTPSSSTAETELATLFAHAGADAQPLLEVARLVRSADPLAPQLAAADRMHRLRADLDRAAERLHDCQTRAGRTDDDLQAAATGLASLREQLQRAGPDGGHDLIVDAVQTIARAEAAASTRATCGPPAGLDRALVEIGRIHGGGEK